MNSPLETGLFLPIRFYDSSYEQDRYKSQSEGVAVLDINLIHVDCDSLAPFQIPINYTGFISTPNNNQITWQLNCAGGDSQIELPYNAGCWQEYLDQTTLIFYTSYLGTDNFSGAVPNGRYYITLMIEDANNQLKIYWSDLFIVSNAGSPYDVVEFLGDVQSASSNNILIDPNNILRIT